VRSLHTRLFECGCVQPPCTSARACVLTHACVCMMGRAWVTLQAVVLARPHKGYATEPGVTPTELHVHAHALSKVFPLPAPCTCHGACARRTLDRGPMGGSLGRHPAAGRRAPFGKGAANIFESSTDDVSGLCQRLWPSLPEQQGQGMRIWLC